MFHNVSKLRVFCESHCQGCIKPWQRAICRFPHWHGCARCDVAFVFRAILRGKARYFVMLQLAILDSTLPTLPTTITLNDSAFYTPHFTLHSWHSTSAIHTLQYTYALHSALYIPHFTLYTPHFALHTPYSTLYTLHSALYTSHSTLRLTLYIPHFTLYTPHFALHTPHFTLYTPHSTLHTPSYALHFTFHTLHFRLHTLRCKLHTLHFTLWTPHSTL